MLTVTSIPAIIQIHHIKRSAYWILSWESHRDGYCFYNSVTLLLHKSEELAAWLRLGSAVWAALHLQHYLQAVSNTHTHALAIDADYTYMRVMAL